MYLKKRAAMAALGGAAAVGHPAPVAEDLRVLTEGEAAERLGLSPRTLQRLRLNGEGPPFVLLVPSGARIGYTNDGLAAFIRGRTVSSTSAATVAKRVAR